jgi:hypothetical protein
MLLKNTYSISQEALVNFGNLPAYNPLNIRHLPPTENHKYLYISYLLLFTIIAAENLSSDG